MEEWIMVLFQLLAFFTHAQRQQNLKKKKESFQICQAKSKFAGAGLATRQSFHSGHLQ